MQTLFKNLDSIMTSGAGQVPNEGSDCIRRSSTGHTYSVMLDFSIGYLNCTLLTTSDFIEFNVGNWWHQIQSGNQDAYIPGIQCPPMPQVSLLLKYSVLLTILKALISQVCGVLYYIITAKDYR